MKEIIWSQKMKTYCNPIWKESIKVCLRNDETIFSMTLASKFLLPQPLSFFTCHWSSSSSSGWSRRTCSTTWNRTKVKSHSHNCNKFNLTNDCLTHKIQDLIISIFVKKNIFFCLKSLPWFSRQKFALNLSMNFFLESRKEFCFA